MSILNAIEQASQAVAKVVAGISPAQLGDPTPCEEWDVRALGNHLTGFLPYSANAARKGPAMEGEAPDFTANDWANTFARFAADTAAAWQEDGALEGEVAFGSGVLPSEYAAAITLMEFTVHGWDLAKATGQTLDLDPQTSAMAAMVTKQAAEGAPPGSDFFGPAVDAPADGTPFDQALAAVGRSSE